MKHFLGYGNSDQVSFRDPAVQASFDYMTVPGTIAAYYQDATAAFVLSSNLSYVIDPRTPLYQGVLASPRASHYSLSEWLGPSVAAHLSSVGKGEQVTLDPGFFTDHVVQEMTDSVIDHQRSYANRATGVEQRIDRYRKLLATAQNRAAEDVPRKTSPPAFVLAPYFAARNVEHDPWWGVTKAVWRRCASLANPGGISAVVALASPSLLIPAMAQVPESLSSTRFFWITDFDERRVPIEDLVALWRAVELAAKPDRRLVNMYGGFFSVCLQKAGLWGFNNGLGYSESRAWPELTSTGAAPPRYYIRDLHAYAPPAVAQLLVEADRSFECPCDVCEESRAAGSSIVGMSYHALKQHFALSRSWECQLVSESTGTMISDHLRHSRARYREVVQLLPPRVRIHVNHLLTWADTITECSGD
jgi:hypothetical protein